ncbi:unnamed protein product [Closterium sp. Yama58-4]|nr:unnamed protein product [Closterium sp. Yama58-4]
MARALHAALLSSSPMAPTLISKGYRLCGSSKAAILLRLVLACAVSALLVFAYICYWSIFVEAAVAKGEALMARGRELRKRGEAEVADGCAVKYDASADPWDSHPLLSDKFSQSGCKLEWVIYSSECGVNMVRLADFAHMAGISFSIIGSRQPWTGQGGRLRAIRDFLAALPRDRVVITTDADDVFLMPHPKCRPQNFLDAFFALNAPVVFGAEIFCWPDWKKLEPYFPHKRSSSVNRFLNAGAYAGYAWALAEIIDLIYVRDCMQDQRGFILAFLAQQYLFRDMPRAPNPDPAAVRAAWESPSDVAEAVRAQAEAAESASREAWRNNRTVQFDSEMSPFHRLPAKPKQRVMDEARRAGHQGTAAVMAAPFIKLDHYSSLFMHLGGLKWGNFTILGTGEQALVRQVMSGGEACILHQQGNKLTNISMTYIMKETSLEELREAKGLLSAARAAPAAAKPWGGIRIDSGGMKNFTDNFTRQWSRDTGFTSGMAGTLNLTGVPNEFNMPMYQKTTRYYLFALENCYEMPVPAGHYLIRMFFNPGPPNERGDPDQRGFILAFLAQQYLFRDMPRAPNPDPAAVRAAWESPSDVAEAVRAQAEAAESASREAWRTNHTVLYDSAMSPFHRLPAKPKQRVMDEARRAGHRGAVG